MLQTTGVKSTTAIAGGDSQNDGTILVIGYLTASKIFKGIKLGRSFWELPYWLLQALQTLIG